MSPKTPCGRFQESTPVAADGRRRPEAAQEPSRKRPMDDSALEEHSPGDPETLEKVPSTSAQRRPAESPPESICQPQLAVLEEYEAGNPQA